MIFCIKAKLPGVTGVLFGAASDAGRESNTRASSSVSNPSTPDPITFNRAATFGACQSRVTVNSTLADEGRRLECLKCIDRASHVGLFRFC